MDPPAPADLITPTASSSAAAVAPTPAAEPPDEETILAARKRSRRVSFAETTAVHVFVRDDDSDSPFASSSSPSQHGSSAASPDSSSADANASPPSSPSSSDDDAHPVLLFRDIDSSSPGSALGSVTSNDDDNFFGPVSTSFIRSGRHSETEASDDNLYDDHNITLDSTAFSLHYRSLADDRSVGSVRTPTVETVGSSSCGVSASESRNAMSLVGEDSKRYDYGKISPALEALLAEVDQSLEPSEPGVVEGSGDGERCGGDDCLMEDSAHQDGGLNPSQVTTQGSPIIDEAQDTGHTVVEDYIKVDREAAQYDVVTANSQNLDLLSPPYKKSPELHFHSDNINQSCVNDEGNLGKCYPLVSPLAPELAIMGNQQQLELECAVRTPTNYVHAFQIPMHGSVSSIHAKRQKLYLEESSFPLEMAFRKHDEKISAMKNQITRFKILETPLLTNFQAALSLEDNMLLDLEGTPSKIADIPVTEHIGVWDNNCENNLINTAESPRGNQMFNLKPSGFDTPNGNRNEKDMVICGIVKSAVTTPTFQLVESVINMNQDSLVAQKPIDRTSSPNERHSSRRQTKVELQKNREEAYFTSGSPETFRSSTFVENTVQPLTSYTSPVSHDLRTLGSRKEPAAIHNGSLLCESHEKAPSSTNIDIRSQDMNIEIKKELLNVSEKLTPSEVCASSCEPACGDGYKEATKTAKGPDKVIYNVSANNNLHSVNLVGSSPSNPSQDSWTHNYCDNNQDFLSVEDSLVAQDSGTAQRKRKNRQILVKENRTINETNRAQNNLRLPKTVSDISGHQECENDEIDVGGQTKMIHPNDIIFKVSEASKELFSTSVYTLTLEKIDMLESLLHELQRARQYERFCVSLGNNGQLSDAQQKRISEARLLQDKLLFEQVKLQLKRVKLHLLHNKAKLYQSRYEECHSLKSMLSRLICRTGASQTHETNLYSDSIHSSDTNQEVASKKQELEMLDQKIKCLLKPFGASCNIRGNMTIDQIIEVLNENLEIRKRCRIIRQDLQLWELSDIVKKNDCSEIVLNYCNLLCQRFTINVGEVSSISSNNTLNESKIEKNFPKMNAQLAFGFVFNVKGAQRLADAKCFQHKTLVTSLLLGTLLDVIKEVEVSRRELWNLVSSSFYSQCSGQLELHLCFFNFKSCGKVTLALDMTFLDCGIYPSKSSELQVRIFLGSQTTLPQSILDKITSAIPCLQDGRPVILNLCRRISEVVQPSS